MSNEPSGIQPPDPGFPEYRSRHKFDRQSSWHPYQPPQDQPAGGQPVRAPRISLEPGRLRRLVVVGIVVLVLLAAGIFFGLRVVRGAGGPAEVPNDGPNAVRTVDWLMSANKLSEILEAKIERNRVAINDGVHPLWADIEYNDHNRAALQALNYFLIDLRVATGMGVDRAEIREYQELINHYEESFWAGEPLGRDVTIQYKDRTFTYDGTTGEGGWTEN